jgi:ubiquinone/menaquinone biosynthesis C-methylase UbiE
MSHYIHGSDPSEQNRLTRLNDLINDRCFPKLKLQSGMHVLDVGSGLGQLTYRLSQAVGATGKCLGIERDANQLAKARQNFSAPNLEFRQGDALQIPFRDDEAGQFDFVHTRFLLEHLSNPAQAVSQMAKALKPGGRIFLFDDDHETMVLFPEPVGFKELWTAYMDSYVEVGNDPFIGRKMPKLLQDHGFREIRNDVVFFGDCYGTETFSWFVANLAEVIATSKTVMIQAALIKEKAYTAAIQNIYEWAKNPYASMWYTIAMTEGVK